ncbi:MAG: hypothetical protein RIA69_10240 [Cyclobacteriaceae bacterium]
MIRLFKQSPLVLFFLLSMVIYSCQDSTMEEKQIEEESIDLDMESAIDLSNDYMNSSSARLGAAISVTVFKYKKDKVYYATNTDDVRGYLELNETTITANIEPGQWNFWFAGAGMSRLDGIEFEESISNLYGINPISVANGKLWALYIPSDVEYEEGEELKYDILYSIRGLDGDPIRLDPKLKINQLK